MNCRKAEKLIPFAAGGDLGREEEAAVREHAASCLPCRSLLARFEKQVSMLGSVMSVEPPRSLVGGLAERALDAARASGPGTGAKPARAPAGGHGLEFWIPAAAAAAVLLIAAIHFAGMEGGGTGPAANPAAQPDPQVAESVAAVRRSNPAQEAGIMYENPSYASRSFPIAFIGGVEDSMPVIANLDAGDDSGEEPGQKSRFMLSEIEPVDEASVSLDF